jgi:hypothetical protein
MLYTVSERVDTLERLCVAWRGSGRGCLIFGKLFLQASFSARVGFSSTADERPTTANVRYTTVSIITFLSRSHHVVTDPS